MRNASILPEIEQKADQNSVSLALGSDITKLVQKPVISLTKQLIWALRYLVWLLFSGQQVSSFNELFSKIFWHGIKLADYPSSKDYRDGLEIVSEPFQILLPKFSDNPKALFMLVSLSG